MDTVFQFAVRNKLRFTSSKGELTVEQLFDVPLTSQDGFNLDAIARVANKAFKEATEESFVSTSRTPSYTRLEMTLETIKNVITVKLAEAAEAQDRVAKQQEKAKLLKALAERQDGKLSKLSEKQITERLAQLD